VLDEQDNVDEVTNPGVLSVAEGAEHGVKLLGSMPVDIDNLDGSCRDTCEVEGVRQGDAVGDVEFVGPG